MKKFFLATMALIALAVGQASAADLATKPVYKASPPPVVAPVYGWTGFYAGVSLGGRWADTTWTTDCLFSNPCTPNHPAIPSFNPSSFNSSTVRVGGYFGYNWQIAQQWVVGLEGDIAWGDSKKTIVGIPGTCIPSVCAAVLSNGFDRSSVKEGWDGSIRGRLGFLVWPTVLFYATGGVTWQEVEINIRCRVFNCDVAHDETATWTKMGWVLGGGAEGRLWSNWLWRLEYRFADYGHVHHTFAADTPTDIFQMTETLKTHTALVGLAYQFTWGKGKAPIVARY